MRAQSSILELVETADGVAIAAPNREIADSSCRSHLSSVEAPSCLLNGFACTRSYYSARQLWPVRLSPTRPQEVIDFEELLKVGALLTCLVRSDAGEDCYPSEINVHIDHSPALGARGWRCVPVIEAQRD